MRKSSFASVTVCWVLLYGSLFAQEAKTMNGGQALVSPRPSGALRIATYNVSLNRPKHGQLTEDLKAGDRQAKQLAAVIRTVKPDILLLNEVDYASKVGDGEPIDNAAVFGTKYLADPTVDDLGAGAWPMPYHYSASVNTGVPSGLDLNNNGKTADPEDAWGFGVHPGQYGMAVLSRYPMDRSKVRSFQNLKWASMPGALVPRDPSANSDYYAPDLWKQLRLSSKSFWDVPIETPHGTLSVLASHPTPPAFDGAEDRNGCRNHDEIRLLLDYISPGNDGYLIDDAGTKGGIVAERRFVILGDLNSDPVDGGSRQEAIQKLIKSPAVAQYPAPRSAGAKEASAKQGKANSQHQGDAAEDTADFSDGVVGNLRADYVLPSHQLHVVSSGVFWPSLEQVPGTTREAMKKCLDATDHHLVWVDVTW